MRSHSLFQALAMSALASNGDSLSVNKAPAPTNRMVSPPAQREEPIWGRRKALQGILGGGIAFLSVTAPVNALDMDAFANSQLESDQKNCNPKTDPKCAPKLTNDEALCKYGQSGDARVEACKRVRAAGGQVPSAGSQGKSLGGAYAI